MRIPTTWAPQEPPLPPQIVVAEGAVARRLVDRLLAHDDRTLSDMNGVAGADIVAIRTSPARLPWVDGVSYYGESPHAPGVYLPTVRRPKGPMPLLAQALVRQAPEGPLIWMPDGRVVPFAAARPLDRDALAAWRRR